ncbi:MAG: S-adenosylmethionine decarboxylase [Pseudomonadota bacterium]
MMPETETFGVHLMIDGYGCDRHLIGNRDMLRALLDRLPVELGMHPIAEPMVVKVGAKNKKDPGGLSGFVMVAESHLSFHTFPARRFITLDIYTCCPDLDIDGVSQRMKERFGIAVLDYFVQKRGLRYPVRDIA